MLFFCHRSSLAPAFCPIGDRGTGILTFTFAWVLPGTPPSSPQRVIFVSLEKTLQNSDGMSPPHILTCSMTLLSTNRSLALCPLPYLRNPTASHNHMPFTMFFISPSALLRVYLSTFWLPTPVPLSILCPPTYHIYNSGKSPILRAEMNS